MAQIGNNGMGWGGASLEQLGKVYGFDAQKVLENTVAEKKKEQAVELKEKRDAFERSSGTRDLPTTKRLFEKSRVMRTSATQNEIQHPHLAAALRREADAYLMAARGDSASSTAASKIRPPVEREKKSHGPLAKAAEMIRYALHLGGGKESTPSQEALFALDGPYLRPGQSSSDSLGITDETVAQRRKLMQEIIAKGGAS